MKQEYGAPLVALFIVVIAVGLVSSYLLYVSSSVKTEEMHEHEEESPLQQTEPTPQETEPTIEAPSPVEEESTSLSSEEVIIADACSMFTDSIFRSVEQHEVGLGPNGPAMGYWEIHFEDDAFVWFYSDFAEYGTYSCNDGILDAILENDSPLNASFNEIEAVLLWDDLEYMKVE